LRSAEQATNHRRAFLELTLLHLALMRGRLRPWPVVAWLLAVTHLGLLGEERRGALVANHLSLLRANLPSLSLSAAPWTAGVALLTDVLDGQLARARKEETAFGAYADPLADLVFWNWYVFRNESSPMIRAAAFRLAPPRRRDHRCIFRAWTNPGLPAARRWPASYRRFPVLDRSARVPAVAHQPFASHRGLRNPFPGAE
jgi:hypothetical protein